MKTADRAGDGAEPVGDPRHDVRQAADDAQRASAADQVAADADQSSADADQTLSNADQSASNADQRSTGIDQLASDRDQAAADRQHAAGVDLTPADEKALKASHDEREAVSIARQRNRVKRARTARHRDATAGKRDRTTETRGEGGRARDARVAVGQRAIDAWETSRRAEDELSRESGAKYRGLLEAAPDAMVVVDGAGEIVLLNVQAEKQFGYHRDELIGQQVANIIPEGFAERLIADDLRSAADALAQQIGSGIELVALRKDGTEFPIEIMLSPLESAEGILVTAAIRNISVRKLAESQLLQAQKLESIGRLAGGIAHDFNNMLFVINGHAEMLDQDLIPAKNRPVPSGSGGPTAKSRRPPPPLGRANGCRRDLVRSSAHELIDQPDYLRLTIRRRAAFLDEVRRAVPRGLVMQIDQACSIRLRRAGPEIGIRDASSERGSQGPGCGRDLDLVLDHEEGVLVSAGPRLSEEPALQKLSVGGSGHEDRGVCIPERLHKLAHPLVGQRRPMLVDGRQDVRSDRRRHDGRTELRQEDVAERRLASRCEIGGQSLHKLRLISSP